MAGPTVSVANLRIMAAAAAKAGVPADGILPPEVLALHGDPDARVPSRIARDLWIEIERRAGDPFIGIRIASLANFTAYSSVEYRLRVSRDAREMLARSVDYMRLLNEAAHFEIVDRGALHFRYWSDDAPIPRIMPETVLAALVFRIRSFTGETKLTPVESSFRCARPDGDLAELYSVFGPARFSAENDEIVLSREDASRPFLAADPSLAAALDAHIAEQIAPLKGGGVTTQVRRRILERIAAGEPVEQEDVARSLGMTARTLQRHLQKEETRYATVLDELRCAVADTELARNQASIEEIAWSLGFHDAAAFHKAYKRWTGRTPAESRVSKRS